MDEHTLNDLLECSVCLERLDTSSKVLPCQHTFCRKCLEVIVASRQELRCPECRVLVAIKIDELPPNVLLMRILEGIKNAAAAKAQTIADTVGTTTTTTPSNDKLQQQQQQQKQLNEEQQKQLQQLKLKQQQQKQLLQYQQQQQQQHGNTMNNTITVTTTPTTSSSHQLHQQQSQQQQQQRRCMVPHAYALYDFNSNETNDLHFKKGDLILLKRKMDANWYIGQLNGKEGTFPINYVQVIVPLPMPQCIALYDFKMGPNEEEGCLSFKKGTLIHVLRRVDHNWAEGRIGTTIGIFPIAFVELNALAKQLLETCNMSTQQQQQQQQHQTQTTQQQTVQQQQAARNLPPIPQLESVNTINNSNSGGECQTATSSSSTTAAAGTTTSSSSTSSSTASSQATSPSTATTTNNTSSSCSSSTRNSPTSALATPTNISSGTSSVRYRGERKEKRHSLNALLIAGAATSTGNAGGNIGSGVGGGVGTLNLLQAHRHSAEILSMPHELCENTTNNVRPRSSGPPLNNETSTMLLSSSHSPPTIPAASTSTSSSSSSSHARINVLKMTGGNSHLVPPTLPWGYLALYPYKPRKSDELELKKGCVYIVTEHCLDGWFKGKNWQDISGVFPGNYVTPLRMRDQQQLMHQWKFVPPPPPPASSSSSNHAATHSPTNQLLPELPPRQQQITTAAVAPPPLAPPTPTPTCTAAVWTKPLSHTVEAFFNRHKNTTPTTVTTTPTTNNTKVENKEQEHKKDSNNVGSSSSSSSSSTSAAVNLMKRLAHIKSRSKSPNQTATQSQQQQQNNLAAVEERSPGHLHAVHVRSGSCPSQLLQNLSPMDLHNSSTAGQTISSSQQLQQQQQQQQHKQSPTIQMTNNVNYAGSQRIKGHKERIQLCTQNTTRTNANNSNNNNTNNDAIYNNLQLTVPTTTTTASTQALLTKCAQQQQQKQQQQYSGDGNTMIHHRKSQSLDANSTLAATQSATTLNTATATATTTTTGTANINKCPRDGRFRCVVPYPPNSDIELELHVGDIIYVQRKQKNGWYKGTHARTHKMGLFPASFVEPDI